MMTVTFISLVWKRSTVWRLKVCRSVMLIKKVGLDIEAGKFTHDKKVHHTHEGSIGNLCNDRIESLMRQVVDGFNFSVMEQAERSF